jgi:hypothetical protein
MIRVKDRPRFRLFESAREFIRSRELKDKPEWDRYYESGKVPDDIPHNPVKMYKKEWKGWSYWLGTHVMAAYMSFEDAQNIVRQLGLESQLQWRRYLKSGQKPADIPTHPDRTYKDEWKGWGDWLNPADKNTLSE